ncbi:hypothetical protein Vretifemale_16907 [Volvox reticuliferus]|nr:hypothetical protein Vretifemale_16907 [Volvox reticuliferus]
MLHNVTPADMVAITASGSGVKTRNATADSSGRRSTKETVRDAAFTHRMRYQRPHSALMASRLTFLHAVDHWRNHGGSNAAEAAAAARRLRGGGRLAFAAAKRLRGARRVGGGGGGGVRRSGATAAVEPRL